MDTNNSIINSMVELLETITDKKVNLSFEINNNPDFSNYLKEKTSTELGGHIPQKNTVSDIEYCLKSDFIEKIIESL